VVIAVLLFVYWPVITGQNTNNSTAVITGQNTNNNTAITTI
jgi:hypothetical protein